MKSPRIGQTRRPLARIHVIHEALLSGYWPNCSSLADQLEVSTKTILRDLDFMRDEFRMPIAFVPEHNGYHYTAPVESFPPVHVGVEELMALFVARKVMAPMAGTALEGLLSDGFRRLSALAGGSAHISWQELDQAFSIQSSGMMHVDVVQIETLSTALVQRKKLRFRYTNAKNKHNQTRTVHPLHLAQVKGGWYLFAWDEKPEDIRIFALPRMEQIELLPETFAAQPAFDLAEYLHGSMGLITEPDAQEIHVVIRFKGYAAVLVPERKWHQSQNIEEQPDKTILLHLTLQHLEDVVGWVLSWGGLAEVLSPPELRGQVARKAKDLAECHQSE